MNKDYWKKVSIGSCVKTIIISLIIMCIVLVPVTFENGIVFTISKLPLIGDGTIIEMSKTGIKFIQDLAHFPDRTMDIFYAIISYGYHIFFGALILDVLFAIALIIFKNNTLRIIFKVFSIIFGVAILIIALVNLMIIFGYFYSCTVHPQEYPFIQMLKTSGITTYFAMLVVGIYLSVKQFKWFAKAF